MVQVNHTAVRPTFLALVAKMPKPATSPAKSPLMDLLGRMYAGTCPDPGRYYAITFASKEAIFKCFATDWETGIQLTDIEIRQGKSGEPIPRITGKLAGLAVERGVSKILLSHSYDGDYIVAIAILV